MSNNQQAETANTQTIHLTVSQYMAADTALEIIDRRLLSDDGECADYSIDPELGTVHKLLMQAVICPIDDPRNSTLLQRIGRNFATEPVTNETDPFNPFGEGVRVGAIGAAADVEIGANLADLCQLHDMPYGEAVAKRYPNGTVMMLQTERDKFGAEIYLNRVAYAVFMAWVES